MQRQRAVLFSLAGWEVCRHTGRPRFVPRSWVNHINQSYSGTVQPRSAKRFLGQHSCRFLLLLGSPEDGLGHYRFRWKHQTGRGLLSRGGELQIANNDSNHYKFGGHERDTETNLDILAPITNGCDGLYVTNIPTEIDDD